MGLVHSRLKQQHTVQFWPGSSLGMEAEEGEIVEPARKRYTTPRPSGTLHGTDRRSKAKNGRSGLKFNRHPFSKSVRNREGHQRVAHSSTPNVRESSRKPKRKDSARTTPFSQGGSTSKYQQQRSSFSKKRLPRNKYSAGKFSKRGGGGNTPAGDSADSRKRSASAHQNESSAPRKRRKRLRKPSSKKFRTKTKKFRMRLNSEGGENEHYGKRSSRPSNLQARKGDRPGFRRHGHGRRWVSRSPPRHLWRQRRRDSKRGSKMRQKHQKRGDPDRKRNRHPGREGKRGKGNNSENKSRRADRLTAGSDTGLSVSTPVEKFKEQLSDSGFWGKDNQSPRASSLVMDSRCAPVEQNSISDLNADYAPNEGAVDAHAPSDVDPSFAEGLPSYTEKDMDLPFVPHFAGKKYYPSEYVPQKGIPEQEEESECSGSSLDEDGDDDAGNFEGMEGDSVGKYKILQELGVGTFGRVLECELKGPSDGNDEPETVAIKVVRKIRRYGDAAKIEADILTNLNELEKNERPGASPFVIRMFNSFVYRKHVCLVFETCGPNLYYFMKRNRRRGVYGFKGKHLQYIVFQIINALAFLHDKCGVVHTDLKLENILFVSDEYFEFPEESASVRLVPKTLQIKLIDFGSAAYEQDYHSSIINTRQYRAPEVVLGNSWSFPSDVWGLGCMAMELLTGRLLFQTHDSFEHLALMQCLCGKFPPEMIQGNKEAIVKGTGRNEVHDFFTDDHVLRYPVDGRNNSESQLHVSSQKNIYDQCKEIFKADNAEVSLFAELCGSLLTLNSKERPSAKDLCSHKYFGDLCTFSEEKLARLALSLPLTEAGIEVSDEEFGSDLDRAFLEDTVEESTADIHVVQGEEAGVELRNDPGL